MHDPQNNMHDVHDPITKLPTCDNFLTFSSADVTLLPSCLLVLSEHVASQSKWWSADLDLLKLAKKTKSVWRALFRGNVCIWSDKA